MFKKSALALLLLPLAFGLTGCDKLGIQFGSDKKSEEPSGIKGFAVIDLDSIAARLGKDAQLQNALRQRQDQINAELTQMRANFVQQIQQQDVLLQEKAKKEGRERTPEEQRDLQNLVNTLNVALNRAQSTGQATLSQDQLKLIQAFRAQVRPHAIEVARERGFSIVLTKNEAVLFAYDESFDITEEVIRRMATPVVP